MKDSNLQLVNIFHDVTQGGIHSHLHQSTLCSKRCSKCFLQIDWDTLLLFCYLVTAVVSTATTVVSTDTESTTTVVESGVVTEAGASTFLQLTATAATKATAKNTFFIFVYLLVNYTTTVDDHLGSVLLLAKYSSKKALR